MRFKTSIFSIFCSVLVVFCLNSCEIETFEQSDFEGDWSFSWQKCGLNHTAFTGGISFTFSDSLGNTGLITRTTNNVIDSLNFQFEFCGTGTLTIDSISGDTLDGLWEGTHIIKEANEGSFLLERQNKACDNEEFKLQK